MHRRCMRFKITTEFLIFNKKVLENFYFTYYYISMVVIFKAILRWDVKMISRN
jgi:hypothetical protein